MKHRHDMPFGAQIEDGGTRFRLWAPERASIDLVLSPAGTEAGSRHAMKAMAGGWHELWLPGTGAGTRYRFALDDGLQVPDPASRFNPLDVHGPSEVVDPGDHPWGDGDWRGRPWHEAVVYELHVGSFTPEGTFEAAAARLPELAALGITAVELMPLADFPGACGWGYDGVLLFAPDATYGTPRQLKQFVDQAHQLGLMVLLDVVYNHFGPEGNYLHAYCESFFNPAHQTPWGAAINFDGPRHEEVRSFFVHNALFWVEEYRFDGLRLDAVHAIRDDLPEPIVCEIARALREGPGRDRQVHLVLENEHNQASRLARDDSGGLACATAQWNDDLHHAAHVLVTGETDGYYADYAQAPVEAFARALAEGFVYQGQPSALRGGEPRGEPSAGLPSVAMVSFLQNHDQIGNRAFGERIHQMLGPDESPARRLEAAYACLLLSPHVPMLFMGEEFAASSPFLYFCDLGPELSAAVAQGRRNEFAHFAAFRDEARRAQIPDPTQASTFQATRLNWEERQQPPHRARLALVRDLLALRHRDLVPRLAGLRCGGTSTVAGGLLQVAWPLGEGSWWHLAANFSDQGVDLPAEPAHTLVYSHRADCPVAEGAVHLGPCGVHVTLEAPRG